MTARPRALVAARSTVVTAVAPAPLPRSPLRPVMVVLLSSALLSLPACKVDKDEFHQRVYSCNPNAANPACGTDIEDRPMACVPAYQLGGRNFCATGCDVATEPADNGAAVCLPSGPRSAGPVSGARLQRCSPVDGENSCHHEELTCLRTDLLADEGVCMTVNSCRSDGDCRDPVRAKCMGELLRQTYGSKSELKADHTYCLQEGCRARRTACSPGESCLRDILPRTSFPPDICVPNCDANGNCPPNYFCYPEVYSKGAPAICIPGLLGLRCRSRLDCMFGECVNTGLPYKVCSVACAGDADCAKFDSQQGTFFCNEDKVCAGARAFRGAFCATDAECIYPGESCARLSPTNPQGVCVQGCAPGTRCPSFGGVPHACRPRVDATGNLAEADPRWVCWPGTLWQLCADDGNCLGGLTCKAVGTRKLCTISCSSDGDCAAQRFAAEGFCDQTLGVCRLPLADGQTCERALQCESKKCGGTLGEGKCDVTPDF